MRTRLVIVNTEQFGYHIDTYYYCKLLKEHYDIHYVGWDHGFDKMELEGIKLTYVSRDGSLARVRRFIEAIQAACAPNPSAKDQKTILFVKYAPGLAVLQRFLVHNVVHVLDIRTGSVTKGRVARSFKNWLMRREASFYRHLTVISESLAATHGWAHRAKIVPLGAVEISAVDKKFAALNMLYVGTLFNRNIDQMVLGVAAYLKSQQDTETDGQTAVTLTVVGGGPGNELDQLRDIVATHDVGAHIKIEGQVPHDKLEHYFDTHNIGMSYIPMTPYFDVQPPTKTFEYLLSGMAVLATATSENARIIQPDNGRLIEDSAAAVQQAVAAMANAPATFDSRSIRQAARPFLWSTIAEGLRVYLDQLVNR